MRWLLAVVGVISAMVALPLSAAASEAPVQKDRGLSISPAREFVSIAPGQSQTKKVTLANMTDHPVDVSLSVEQFTVADFTYDYSFSKAKETWLQLSETGIKLQPGKSKSVEYRITPPANAKPGGHYFTVFASAHLQAGEVGNVVRAASQVYVTVGGELTATASLQNAAVPRISFGGDIPYTMDIKATGNTHFFVYVGGELQGWSAKGAGLESTRLVMPNTTLTVGGTLPAPLLPGIYTVVYGYKTDTGTEVRRSMRIAYLPLWSLCIVAGLLWLLGVYTRRNASRWRWRGVKDFSPRRYK